MSSLLSVSHPGFVLDSDRCLQTACLAAALPAPVPGAHPVPVMDSLFIQLFLGQKEEISMENGSLSLPLLRSLTLPQGSTNIPPPQADSICQLAHLLMCERSGLDTPHPPRLRCAYIRLYKHMFMCHSFTMWFGISSPTLVVTFNCLPPHWPLCRLPG